MDFVGLSWEPSGDILDFLRAVSGLSGAVLGLFWPVITPLGGLLGRFGAISGVHRPSWTLRSPKQRIC
eukprot:6398411-Pyramimonas_sp.AAC.1